MEIFGIPIYLIIILIVAGIVSYNKEKQTNKEKVAQQWSAISTGMSKDEVLRRFGQPNRVWQAGSSEIWGYGSSDSDGLIKFLDQMVVSYQKPD